MIRTASRGFSGLRPIGRPPPAGWQPPAGWRPDPSWPPPPAGWDFWAPTPGRKPPRFSILTKTIAGALTLVATAAAVAGAYFAFRSQPHSPTTAGWITQANAACDRDNGSLHMSFFEAALPESDQTAGQNVSAGQQKASRLRNLIAVEGSLSKLNGDLAALQMPQDSRAPDVRAVLRSGNALVDSMNNFSGAMQAAVESNSAVSAVQITTEVKDADMVLVSVVTWEKAIRVLDLYKLPVLDRQPAERGADRDPAGRTGDAAAGRTGHAAAGRPRHAGSGVQPHAERTAAR